MDLPRRSRTRSPSDRERALADWERHVATLDTAILSLIGENDIPDEGIEAALDDILQSSLWHRRLLRQNEQVQQVLKAGLVSRSRLIWSQSTAARRRGYFLAGVGLTTGHALDAIAADANLLLIQANGAILEGDAEAAIAAITGIAERVFAFYPFTPDPMPANWRDILRAWLLGQPLAAIAAGQESETLQFIEGGLVYRLPWAMEAIRVRAAANGDTVGVDFLLEDHELGLAVPAVETGTLNRSASILIQAGFNSRLAAIKAVTDTGATFQTGQELRQWLNSEASPHGALSPIGRPRRRRRCGRSSRRALRRAKTALGRIADTGRTWHGSARRRRRARPSRFTTGPVRHACSRPMARRSARCRPRSIPARAGLLRAQVAQNVGRIDITYLGPDDLSGA